MRTGHGMDGETDLDAAFAEFVGKFAHLMLRLRHGHAVTGHDDDLLALQGAGRLRRPESV